MIGFTASPLFSLSFLSNQLSFLGNQLSFLGNQSKTSLPMVDARRFKNSTGSEEYSLLSHCEVNLPGSRQRKQSQQGVTMDRKQGVTMDSQHNSTVPIEWETLKALLKRPVAFHRVFAEITGGALAGLFLSQLFYWSDRTTDPDGWLYKSQDEWEQETALNRREQEKVRKRLKTLGLLQEKKEGLPCRLYFRLNRDHLCQLMAGRVEALSIDKFIDSYGSTLTGLSKAALMRARKQNETSEYVDYREIIKRHGLCCQSCGDPVRSLDSSIFEHVLPLSEGGTHTLDNVRLIHAECKKKAETPVVAQSAYFKQTGMASSDSPVCLESTLQSAYFKQTGKFNLSKQSIYTEITAKNTSETTLKDARAKSAHVEQPRGESEKFFKEKKEVAKEEEFVSMDGLCHPSQAVEVEVLDSDHESSFDPPKKKLNEDEKLSGETRSSAGGRDNKTLYPRNIDGSDRLPWHVPGKRFQFDAAFEQHMLRRLAKSTFYKDLMLGEALVQARKHISAGDFDLQRRAELEIEWAFLHQEDDFGASEDNVAASQTINDLEGQQAIKLANAFSLLSELTEERECKIPREQPLRHPQEPPRPPSGEVIDRKPIDESKLDPRIQEIILRSRQKAQQESEKE